MIDFDKELGFMKRGMAALQAAGCRQPLSSGAMRAVRDALIGYGALLIKVRRAQGDGELLEEEIGGAGDADAPPEAMEESHPLDVVLDDEMALHLKMRAAGVKRWMISYGGASACYVYRDGDLSEDS